MKQIFKSLILALLTLLPTTALAHDFEVNGIYYLKNGTKATVTYKGTSFNQYSNEYSGDVTIPSTVTYGGTTYSVTSIGDYAFFNCSGLTSVTIPNSVTTIGVGAFYQCSGLTSVIIPNSVTTIGEMAFYFCSRLTSITIPNSLRTIGREAFYGCSGLTSVAIPNSVTTIGSWAFYGCYGLTSITVASGNPNYDSRNNCNAIIETASNTLILGCNNTVIPNSVTNIGSAAFYGCSGLTSITIPNSVRTIGSQAFCFCYGLTSINIPNSVTNIDSSAFSSCSGLTSVTIPNSVTNIGNSAFSSCSGLTNVTIPNSVTNIGSSAFSSCSGLTSINVESENPNYDSRNNCNAIIETASNTLIAGCINTTIPNSVTTIGDGAFKGCSKLTSITIPNSVTTIGSQAFYHCYGLTSINIPNSVTNIGSSAFSSCRGLTSITIPNSVTNIDIQAFQSCSRLTSVTCLAVIPPTTGYNTFSGVTSQATLYVLRESVAAYQTADNWKDFSQIVGLMAGTDFEVDGLLYRALDESTAMVIQRLDEEYYQGDIVIPEAVTYEGYVFTVTAIDEGAFEDCYDLNSVVIGDAVENIGENAFQGCTGLTSVTIGSGVTNIGAKAFNYCNALQTVTCRGTVPPVMASSNCFTNATYSRAILKVPRPEIETYTATDYWYKFSHIEGWGYLGPGDVNGDGVVGMDDLTRLITILVTDDLGGTDPTWADVNANGMVNMNDLTALINLLVFGHQ